MSAWQASTSRLGCQRRELKKEMYPGTGFQVKAPAQATRYRKEKKKLATPDLLVLDESIH